jgi:hypothetical protein
VSLILTNLTDRPFVTEDEIQNYMKMLDEFDMTERERREYVLTLYGVMEHFVDMAFAQDPISLARKAKLGDG